MKNIQPITIWINGEEKSAELINVFSQYDDLETRAVFHYELLTIEEQGLAKGNIDIDGQDYIDWGVSSDINLSAYTYVVNKLNLVLA